ncbi:elongation of very long chain fatty acids protein F [Zeugodacus cucurbitae]|uniref:Elongation of very long chain fatty acids protein n=1 Tax=Zeugodacus cucurbitae TaxID=28588 RepID=A0A0A1XEZ9_ZEUCU|nr:elongation of very long chain fatty acids protein F [Zeugodacus cucurbitae]
MLSKLYDVVTRPSTVKEAYDYMPYHGAILPMIIVNIFFAVFAFRLGPWLMRNRQPFNLKRILMVYNIFQIIYNTYMTGLSIYLLYWYVDASGGFSCIRHLDNDHPVKNFEIFCAYLCLVNKFIDYMETLFFILRKSFKQVTVLHVYHHIMMTSFVYVYITNQGVGGHGATVLMLNALVHAVMYVYYLMSSINPELKKSLWWKKYITQMQIVQFVIDFVHQMWPVVVVRDCPIAKRWNFVFALQAVVMLYMFGNFYIKTYIRKPKALKTDDKQL